MNGRVGVSVGGSVFVGIGVWVGVLVGRGRIGVPPTTMVAPGVVPNIVNRFEVGSYCAMKVIPSVLGVVVPTGVGLGMTVGVDVAGMGVVVGVAEQPPRSTKTTSNIAHSKNARFIRARIN